MTSSVLFLDDGGVMNDPRRRRVQWYGMVGEFFAPVLGGPPQAWAEANRAVYTAMFEPGAWEARTQAALNYSGFERTYQLDWLRGMCDLVGVAAPSQEEGLELAREAMRSILPRVRADFPGAVEAIKHLHTRGYSLHTASGESSTDLAGYLGGMGVEHCFGHLYGPDLVDTFKEDREYYRRIFADAGVSPGDAIVVDDNLSAALRAAATGARTVLVSTSAARDTRVTAHITSLVELPRVLERLE